ncbi:MAG: GCN5-related N-acetyltransferase [Devosia sp.]|uniref:GNAT family N-acetyltransferase n=1 Tax=Devosia sp. TaxID=1871048 RepID=UPI002637694E|nr:GNAT family N-acetyltransferase [Devosia sp.]MDB5530470.1 GCN5-related N-acetyltransferase [Devosia sp.]
MVMKLTFKPVTKANHQDFETLFGMPSAPKYCWCMAYRATPEEVKESKSSDRRRHMFGRIKDDVPVGLVGYVEGQPVAWVSIAPRDTYHRLHVPTTDTLNVWSLVCMYARREVRGQGVAHQLIKAAIAQAKKHKADVVEAYPVDRASPSYRFGGFVPAFEKAGFHEVGMSGTRRHVMRLDL